MKRLASQLDQPETWVNGYGQRASIAKHLGAYWQVVCPGLLIHGEVADRDTLAERLSAAGFRRARG